MTRYNFSLNCIRHYDNSGRKRIKYLNHSRAMGCLLWGFWRELTELQRHRIVRDVKIVQSGADQRKHQSSASLAFVRGIHRWPVNSPHKWPVTRGMFPFDDVVPSYANKDQTRKQKHTQTNQQRYKHDLLCSISCGFNVWVFTVILYRYIYMDGEIDIPADSLMFQWLYIGTGCLWISHGKALEEL